MLFSLLAIFVAITVLMVVFTEHLNFFNWLLIVMMFGFWIALASFFRIPKRSFVYDEQQLISPADGTICCIEEVHEKEYLDSDCLMVSVFMYGTDVHVNRYPISGTVEYVKYHKGNYFVASHPKSSIMNERASIGMLLDNGQRILIRQVAGVMARRIVCYAKQGEVVKQNQELGFIKFGSRVDVFLPLSAKVQVTLGQKVKGCITHLAQL